MKENGGRLAVCCEWLGGNPMWVATCEVVEI